MNNLMPCGLEEERCRFESSDIDHQARAVESYADELMADCRVFHNAESINSAHDLYDGNLLPDLMVAIANWTGSTESAATQMRVLHNLLSDALQKVAEGELA